MTVDLEDWEPTPASVSAALAGIRTRITEAGGDVAGVTVVAVTKDQPSGAINAALEAGLMDLGENRAEALVERAESVASSFPEATSSAVRWHYLAAVQRNKVARLAPHVTIWQSVDRREAGAAIARLAPGAGVLVQANLTDDAKRGGVALAQVPQLVVELQSDGVDVQGVMAVGPPGPPELARPGFRAVVAIADDLGLPVRSLGMSGDLEVGVACGSTMVRIGAALFGPRRRQFNTVD